MLIAFVLFFYPLVLSFFYCVFTRVGWSRDFHALAVFLSCFLKRENYSARMTMVLYPYLTSYMLVAAKIHFSSCVVTDNDCANVTFTLIRGISHSTCKNYGVLDSTAEVPKVGAAILCQGRRQNM